MAADTETALQIRACFEFDMQPRNDAIATLCTEIAVLHRGISTRTKAFKLIVYDPVTEIGVSLPHIDEKWSDGAEQKLGTSQYDTILQSGIEWDGTRTFMWPNLYPLMLVIRSFKCQVCNTFFVSSINANRCEKTHPVVRSARGRKQKVEKQQQTYNEALMIQFWDGLDVAQRDVLLLPSSHRAYQTSDISGQELLEALGNALEGTHLFRLHTESVLKYDDVTLLPEHDLRAIVAEDILLNFVSAFQKHQEEELLQLLLGEKENAQRKSEKRKVKKKHVKKRKQEGSNDEGNDESFFLNFMCEEYYEDDDDLTMFY